MVNEIDTMFIDLDSGSKLDVLSGCPSDYFVILSGTTAFPDSLTYAYECLYSSSRSVATS